MPGPVLFDRVRQKCIEFNDSIEFTIGRSLTCNINIPDTCISRCQCVIKKMPEGEWLIHDKSSFKSTYLNGNKIPQSGQYLKSLDVITFSTLESWQLVFYESNDDIPPSAKRRKLDNDQNLQAASHDSLRLTLVPKSVEASNATNNSYEQKCEALTEELEAVMKEKKNLETELKRLEEEKERVDDILIGSHLDSKQLLEEFEDSRLEIERLAQERNELQEELLKKKDASEAATNSFGTQSQSEIESNLIMKSIEVEELKDELQDAKQRLDKAEDLVKSLSCQNEKVYNDAVAVLEQEFLCCVCSDLLYEPVTLNCRHTICRDCLKEWKKKKKECPSCRTKIKFEVSPLMVDAFIDRIAPLLGEEFLKKREESKRERTAPQTPPLLPPVPIPPPPPPGSSRGGRGRNRGRRGRNVYNNAAAFGIPPPFLIPEVIDLTDRSPGQAPAPQPPRYAEEADMPDESDTSSEAGSLSSFEPPFLGEYDSGDGYDYTDTFIDDDDDDDDEDIDDDMVDDEYDDYDEDEEVDDEE